MELLLNLLWFIVAAGLTGFLLRHQRTRVFRRRWGTVLVATLFTAVLLFPVISASDDLYSSLCLSEDVSRRALNVVGAHAELAPAVALLCSITLSSAPGRPCRPERIAESSFLIVLPILSRSSSSLRAPPAADHSL